MPVQAHWIAGCLFTLFGGRVKLHPTVCLSTVPFRLAARLRPVTFARILPTRYYRKTTGMEVDVDVGIEDSGGQKRVSMVACLECHGFPDPPVRGHVGITSNYGHLVLISRYPST